MNIYETKDWYYVQAFKKNVYAVTKTVVFAKGKKEAQEKAVKWARSKGYDGSINMYRNNYKAEASAMVSINNFVS